MPASGEAATPGRSRRGGTLPRRATPPNPSPSAERPNSRFSSKPPSATIFPVRATLRRAPQPMPDETPDLFNSDYADMAKALLDAGAEFLLVGGYEARK